MLMAPEIYDKGFYAFIYFLLSEWVNTKKIFLYWAILLNISCGHFGKINSSIFSIFLKGYFHTIWAKIYDYNLW